MPRDYRVERDAVIERWYGGPHARQSRRARSRRGEPITSTDCVGIPAPVNAPYFLWGHCMAWKYGLNNEGYGTVTIDGKQQLAHRAVFAQTRGIDLEDKGVNHLCNRPYCVQPSHLYPGTAQDNKDDAQIFNNAELSDAPWILLFPEHPYPKDPLRQRLLESDRYDSAETWEPEVQPPTLPLEEFTCPGHDFAITMQGGNSKICRICETSEFAEKIRAEDEIPFLIRELWPVSQMVGAIREKMFDSAFSGDSYRESRRRAYDRVYQRFNAHDLRHCECCYCSRDRRIFRAAIDGSLTKEDSEFLDACARMGLHIDAALRRASADIMEVLGTRKGLNWEEIQILKDHYAGCRNTWSNFTTTADRIEHEFGYFLHALTRLDRIEDMADDEFTKASIQHHWHFFRATDQDMEDIQQAILPLAKKTSDKLTTVWAQELEGLSKRCRKGQNDLHAGFRDLVDLLAMKHLIEYLRYELSGRNSYGAQQPHPHYDCAITIMETGRADPPLPMGEFEEGRGYRPTSS